MTYILNILASTLALLVIACSAVAGAPSANAIRACEGLASYQLTLKTLWSKETFPNQYPTYRPPAQWSKLVGRSHSGRYTLWSEGKLASNIFKEFAEEGQSTGLDVESQGSRSIFDAFMAPSISAGVGSTDVKFLIHPKYHKFSFVVRMIPSPDWFIGVDNVDLCTSDGQWKSELTLDLPPMDAGTDRGFTFTSPNWPEGSPKPIHVITSKYPNHPASSFYDPSANSLPPIAKLQLTKIDLAWNEDITKDKDQLPLLSPASADRASRMVYFEDSKSSLPKFIPVVTGGATSTLKPDQPRKEFRANIGRRVVRKTRISGNVHNGQASRSQVALAVPPVDCEVSFWGDWSPCSKTCGFGVRMRSRSIIRRPSNGGIPCPLIREEQMCGSMRNCGWQYFSRSNRSPPANSQG